MKAVAIGKPTMTNYLDNVNIAGDWDPFPGTICDIGKYVKYLVTTLCQLFCACCRDNVVGWCQLLICPIDYHYKMCLRFGDNKINHNFIL